MRLRALAAAALLACPPLAARAEGGASDAPAAPAPPAARPAPPAAQPAPPPPGDEDRERAARALERTLVERGGLLLEPGRFEVVPELSYEMADVPVIRQDGTALPGRLSLFTGTATLRLGLPMRLQLGGEVPWVFAQHSPTSGASATESALGDVRAGATLHLLRASGRLPDVLVGAFYKSRTGRSAFDQPPARVPTGTGVEQFGGSLAIVKALDPVVLLLSGEVTESVPRKLEQGYLDLRTSFGISTSILLAVSPETSLLFGLEQSYSQYAQIAGRGIPGTNRSDATLVLGLTTAVSRAGILEARVGVGLTEGVPRVALALGLPLQF